MHSYCREGLGNNRRHEPAVGSGGRLPAPQLGSWLVIALLGALLLSACDPVRRTPASRHANVEITTLGGPLHASGLTYPLTVEIKVTGEDGAPVRFDHNLVADARGSRASITLPAGTQRTSVQLLRGRDYTLHAVAYDADKNYLAVGESHLQVGTAPVAVVLKLNTLLGSSRLAPRLPVSTLVPGQTLDLVHSVMPPGREDLHVPHHELEVTYGGNAEVLAFSPNGVRVRIGSRQDGDVEVTATSTGLTLTEEGVQVGSITSSFSRPFITGVNADVTSPIVEAVAYDPIDSLLIGVSYDDQSLTRVEVYDGPHLLATSDPEDAISKGAPVVTFPGGSTTFRAQIALAQGTYDLTVLAVDLSGNQTAVEYEAIVP